MRYHHAARGLAIALLALAAGLGSSALAAGDDNRTPVIHVLQAMAKSGSEIDLTWTVEPHVAIKGVAISRAPVNPMTGQVMGQWLSQHFGEVRPGVIQGFPVNESRRMTYRDTRCNPGSTYAYRVSVDLADPNDFLHYNPVAPATGDVRATTPGENPLQRLMRERSAPGQLLLKGVQTGFQLRNNIAGGLVDQAGQGISWWRQLQGSPIWEDAKRRFPDVAALVENAFGTLESAFKQRFGEAALARYGGGSPSVSPEDIDAQIKAEEQRFREEMAAFDDEVGRAEADFKKKHIDCQADDTCDRAAAKERDAKEREIAKRRIDAETEHNSRLAKLRLAKQRAGGY